MRHAVICLLAVLLLAGAPSAHAGEFIADGHGTLAIDEVGRVEAVNLESQHGKAINAAVGAKMARWRFEPVSQDGQPVKALAHMRFLLRARMDKESESLAVSIADVDFVDPPAQEAAAWDGMVSRSPPSYPREMIQRRLGARVELAVALGPDGAVLRAAPTQGWLVGRDVEEHRQAKYMARFVDASLKAVQSWRFAPPEPGQDLVYVPFQYAISEDSSRVDTARWQPAAAVAFDAEPWMLANAGKGVALAADGARLRQDLKLISPIDG